MSILLNSKFKSYALIICLIAQLPTLVLARRQPTSDLPIKEKLRWQETLILPRQRTTDLPRQRRTDLPGQETPPSFLPVNSCRMSDSVSRVIAICWFNFYN